MNYDFTEVMLKKSDEELLTIVYARRYEYSQAALIAAEAELDRRQLPEEFIRGVVQGELQIKDRQMILANEPLDNDSKLLAMFFPPVGMFLYAPQFIKGGYERKLTELNRACLKGKLMYLTIAVLSIAFFILAKR